MLKIAVTGPESSGKTTLANALSKHFKVSVIPEYARSYLENKEGKYAQKDLDLIAKGQFNSIRVPKNNIAICDTDFIVLEIWSQYKYANVSKLITGFANKNLFDLHILCSPDIPWEEDVLRENPDSRMHLFTLYKEALNKYNKNYIVVSGLHENRMKKSLEEIDKL